MYLRGIRRSDVGEVRRSVEAWPAGFPRQRRFFLQKVKRLVRPVTRIVIEAETRTVARRSLRQIFRERNIFCRRKARGSDRKARKCPS